MLTVYVHTAGLKATIFSSDLIFFVDGLFIRLLKDERVCALVRLDVAHGCK